MSITIESVTKWQPPAVLHLLPFSKNNAAVASSGPTNQQASYAREATSDGFPSLWNGQNKALKPRSKSAVVTDDNRYSQKQQQQQQRLLRASSERLSRSQRRLTSRSYIERAQSEYTIKTDRKLTQEVVTFAIKDINEQILGRNRQHVNNSPDSETVPKTENGRHKVKQLLKPVLKLNEGRWPQSNARFWRSSTISPGERELQRHKTSLDVQLSALKQSKRVKLNVKDLPRSQTPIGENDPDKLNMKQVIAFLQSSGEVSGGVHVHDDNDVRNQRKSIQDNNKTNKNDDKLFEPRKMNGLNDNNTALVIAAKSRRKEDHSVENSHRLKKTETPINHESNQDNINSSNNADPNRDGKGINHIVNPRPNSYTPDVTNSTTEHSKHHKDENDTQQYQRPKSIQFLKENTEFRIPARIRQIRESTMDNRPFRLHRFLTLVSNSPEDVSRMTKKPKGRLNGVDSRLTSRSDTRSSSKTSQSREDNSRETSKSQQCRTYPDANGYFLNTDGLDKNDMTNRKEGRRRSKHPQSHSPKKLGVTEKDGAEKIICLPTVPVDLDSDDDFINLPSVPSKSTRKDLVLSAHGHAILAKHFPQVNAFQKSNIRPHSEKILLKRRMDISNGKERPSSVKPSDLIEWGGMDNPGKIFLTEQNDEPISKTNNFLENSNQSPKPVSTNEEIVKENHTHQSESSNHSDRSAPDSKIDSKSRTSGNAIVCPSENSTPENETNENYVKDGVYKREKSGSGANAKLEPISPSLSDPVRLTLRKERNLTREHTYMVDMESPGNNVGDKMGHNYSRITMS